MTIESLAQKLQMILRNWGIFGAFCNQIQQQFRAEVIQMAIVLLGDRVYQLIGQVATDSTDDAITFCKGITTPPPAKRDFTKRGRITPGPMECLVKVLLRAPLEVLIFADSWFHPDYEGDFNGSDQVSHASSF
ncbi:hypothetical protein HK57_00404 [Aspergillus ustus]|uniref:Uncharacterized protein n=1 Tax=Aspergillus ustus TaxID=40382 RepID=A0A0C1C3Z3_ASPUT|nr:hypothetical protein HK57_00404 [Aspergillus ustus]